MMATREQPLGGKRAKMGTGRARASGLNLLLGAEYKERLSQLADAEGVTRTVLIERWIEEHTPPLPPGPPAPK